MSWDIINPRGQPKGWNDGLLAPAGGRTLFVAGQTASDGSGRVHPADFVTQFRARPGQLPRGGAGRRRRSRPTSGG